MLPVVVHENNLFSSITGLGHWLIFLGKSVHGADAPVKVYYCLTECQEIVHAYREGYERG
jgi:hypothetical protein